MIKAVRSGDWSRNGDTVVAGGVVLEPDEFTLKLVPTDNERSAALPGDIGLVVLDTDVTHELEVEGTARDLIRRVQQARRDASLDVSDRIVLSIAAGAVWIEALDAHRDFVMAETLAVAVTVVSDENLQEPLLNVVKS